MNKKGQTKGAGGAATLVLLVAVFILLYIILIPSEDRNELLDHDSSDTTVEPFDRLPEQVLLQSQPGEIIADADGTIKHEMLPVLLFLRDKPEVQTLATSLTIENSLFGSKDHTLTFNIEDQTNLKDTALFFYVQQADGNLQVTLNDNIVYDQEVRPLEVERIILPTDKVGLGENTLKLSVNKGIFGSNSYELNTIEIRNNFEVENRVEERSIDLELPVSESKLTYSLFCKSDSITTTLTIFVNNKEQFDGIVPCTSTQSLDINTDVLIEGQNSILFEIDRGEYQISNIVLNTKSDKQRGWSSSFFVASDTYSDIRSESKEVSLMLELSGKKKKEADIKVNGELIILDTDRGSYETFITSLIKKGTNTISVDPFDNFRIDDLVVKLHD